MGLERKGGGEDGDRIEREGSSFLSRVREGYRALVRTEPVARLIEASGLSRSGASVLRTILEETFPETFSPKGLADGWAGYSVFQADGNS